MEIFFHTHFFLSWFIVQLHEAAMSSTKLLCWHIFLFKKYSNIELHIRLGHFKGILPRCWFSNSKNVQYIKLLNYTYFTHSKLLYCKKKKWSFLKGVHEHHSDLDLWWLENLKNLNFFWELSFCSYHRYPDLQWGFTLGWVIMCQKYNF